jgi:hypothetical protein
LSGDTWRFFCDWELGHKKKFDPEKVRSGDTIFVEYDSLNKFSRKYLPKIKHKFILITPNCEWGSDNPLPGKHASLLENKKVAAWFLQNIDTKPSSRVIPIPIGLANQIWDHGNTKILDQYIEWSKTPCEKNILAYVNFSVHTNAKERGPCLHYFSMFEWAKVMTPKNFSAYLNDLLQSVFVISPPGNGMDCHRTWEALLLGCYPIVKHSTLDPLYEGLPVVMVHDWSEVTYEFLQRKLLELQSLSWSRDKLYAHYWFMQVRTLQRNLKAS